MFIRDVEDESLDIDLDDDPAFEEDEDLSLPPRRPVTPPQYKPGHRLIDKPKVRMGELSPWERAPREGFTSQQAGRVEAMNTPAGRTVHGGKNVGR
jgi:hypothetical protein